MEQGAASLVTRPAGGLDVATAVPSPELRPSLVAVVGLGYVGLPTSLALAEAGFGVMGVDVSERRLENVRQGAVDLLDEDHARLRAALAGPGFELTSDVAAIAEADVVLICVPTPVDHELRPDLGAVRSACRAAVTHAREGQTIILTSTTSVGTTRELLVRPLAERRLLAGEDVHVAFSPERIDPGNSTHQQSSVPRVIGGTTRQCAFTAAAVLGRVAAGVHIVSSPEAAELTKLFENTFRAVNIALANELAGVTRGFGLCPIEVTDAAATKPYGYLPFYPGPGVGGHCIPCDPHYLLEGVRAAGGSAPLVERAMDAIAERPREVVASAERILVAAGRSLADASVLVLGVAYKPGVQDVRESPGIEILHTLADRGARVAFHDPLVTALELPGDRTLLSTPDPAADGHDLVIVACVHPDMELDWLAGAPRVLDATYRTPGGRERFLL